MPLITIDLRMLYASGIGTYLQNLIPRLIEAKTGWTFCLIGKKNDLEKQVWSQQKNVNLIDDDSPIYSIQEQINLYQKIPKSTALFWSPHYNIPILYRKKLLVTIHDLFHRAKPEYLDSLAKKFYAKFMFKRVSQQANAILCVSNFTYHELLRFYPKSTATVIHNGIDDSWFEIKKSEPVHHKPYFIALGNVKPHKNLSTLLDAFRMLAHKIPHDLIIVGKREGFLTPDLNITQQAQSLGDRIHFTGYTEEKLLKQYVKQADALIFPSFYEGFGLPPLEAMACACPTIVSHATSLPEVCGDASLYFNPHSSEDLVEKIESLLTQPELRKTLIEKGLSRAKTFNWNKTANRILEVMQDILFC